MIFINYLIYNFLTFKICEFQKLEVTFVMSKIKLRDSSVDRALKE